jgi:hypothetical protein
MEIITANLLDAQMRYKESTSYRRNGLRSVLIGGLISLISGVLFPLLGSLLTAASWLVGNNRFGYSLHGSGSIFLILTVPTLVIAAFCLDAYENRANRSAPVHWPASATTDRKTLSA